MDQVISIRKAKMAKVGLKNFIKVCNEKAKIPLVFMVEVGSYVGDSTGIFSEAFENVTAIDPWVNGYDDTDGASYIHPMATVEAQFDRMCEKHPNIKKIKAVSSSVVDQFEDESLDMVYIDAVHQYENVIEDIKAWYPKVKVGGIVAGHDFQDAFPGCKKAVVDSFGLPQISGEDSSWGIVKGSVEYKLGGFR